MHKYLVTATILAVVAVIALGFGLSLAAEVEIVVLCGGASGVLFAGALNSLLRAIGQKASRSTIYIGNTPRQNFRWAVGLTLAGAFLLLVAVQAAGVAAALLSFFAFVAANFWVALSSFTS